MPCVVTNMGGNSIGLLEEDASGGITISPRNGSPIARYDIAYNITKNYITGIEERGNTLRSCLKEYLSG